MNDIDDLRKHLFETLEALKDKKAPMEIDRAKAISDIAQTIINSAKVEVDYAKATGGTINFIKEKKELPSGISNITQHRVR